MIGRIALWFAFAFAANGAIISVDFSRDPKTTGWKSFGDPSLFSWNNTNQNLEVTWDSSRSNSFFYLPLPTILAKSDDFTFTFDIRLRDIRLGISPGKTNTFEIAIGLLNSHSITNTNYFRGAGTSATYGVRNLVEFDYFPASGTIKPTFATTAVSSNNCIAPVHNFPLEMTVNDLFQISVTYTASNQVLHTSALKNGAPFGLPPDNMLGDLNVGVCPDFRVDAFGISSYNDAIQTSSPQYWGSVLAHGTIDNVVLTIPNPPIQPICLTISNATPLVQFLSRTNWLYTLQRSTLPNWSDTGPTVFGTGGILSLNDTNVFGTRAFYRLRLDRP